MREAPFTFASEQAPDAAGDATSPTMNIKHLLLATLAHVAIVAAAQDGNERTVFKNVDVRNDNGTCTVTITTTENGATTTKVLTGDEAKAYMKGNGTCQVVSTDGGSTTCTVVISDDGGKGHGTQKASVMRYKYTAKPATRRSAPTTQVVAMPEEMDVVAAVSSATEVPGDVFTFFPNPSNGQCTMRYELPGEGPADITILDPVGREVYTEHTSGQGPRTSTIDLTGKGPGQFIAKLAQGSVTLFKKLVIN